MHAGRCPRGPASTGRPVTTRLLPGYNLETPRGGGRPCTSAGRPHAAARGFTRNCVHCCAAGASALTPRSKSARHGCAGCDHSVGHKHRSVMAPPVSSKPRRREHLRATLHAALDTAEHAWGHGKRSSGGLFRLETTCDRMCLRLAGSINASLQAAGVLCSGTGRACATGLAQLPSRPTALTGCLDKAITRGLTCPENCAVFGAVQDCSG